MRALILCKRVVLIACTLVIACGEHAEDDHADMQSHVEDGVGGDGAHVEAHTEPTLTWDQLSLGCAPMGSGEAAHIMCNHGHSLSLHNENLYERWLYAKAHGVQEPNENQLMMAGPIGDGVFPAPLTPVLRARLGERTRIRVVSYGGTQFHDFHIHGHNWVDGGEQIDTKTVGPMESINKIEFFAGAGATDPTPRSGVGDWMYHCHVEVHAITGMWGMFRVLPADSTAEVGKDGRYPEELDIPEGGTGTTVDVYLVAAEAPIQVARAYSPFNKTLDPVERLARVYVRVPTKAAFDAATAANIEALVDPVTFRPPVVRARQGTTLRMHLRNVMESAPCSLHVHGVQHSAKDDGTLPENVAHAGGAEVLQTWVADAPGTWPMHDHARAIENIGRGLFGALVVTTAEEEARVDRDYLVFFHDFDMDWMMGSAQPAGDGH